MFISFFYKFKGPEHVSMITDGDCRHLIVDRFFVKAFDRSRSIKQGKLGMNM
jgi:hypothetical protein